MELAVLQGDDVAGMSHVFVGIDHHLYRASFDPDKLVARSPMRIVTDNIAHNAGRFAAFKMHDALSLEDMLIHGSDGR